jgi:hypothetical protein
MLAQWISKAVEKGYQEARREPLITLGSAPLNVPEFLSVVLGQLGEPRLSAAIDTDIAGRNSHSSALDADTTGPLKDIHRRVGATILFESSGGHVDRVAHLPELRFALGEPGLDTTSIDNAALALESKAYYIRKVSTDGFRIFHQPTLKKVVNDRKASLDHETEVKPTMRSVVQKLFEKGATLPIVPFPADSSSVSDSPRLTLVVMDPELEWSGGPTVRQQVSEWSRRRGKEDRLYPGALIWCFRKPGRDLRSKMETWLAWKRVSDELVKGVLGADFDRSEKAGIHAKVSEAEDDARDEVWAGYRFIVLVEHREPDGLKVIDLGAGHASSSDCLCGRVLAALKSEGLLNDSVGAGYIERNWPPALKESGAWPLTGLRKSFLDGSLTRLPDPDATLRKKIVEFVEKGDFGLGSAQLAGGGYQRLWFQERVGPDEVSFEPDLFLIAKAQAQALKAHPVDQPKADAKLGVKTESGTSTMTSGVDQGVKTALTVEPGVDETPSSYTFQLRGEIPSEVWNRLGTKLLTKMKSGTDLKIGVELAVTVKSENAAGFEQEIRQVLEDLGLSGKVQIQRD